MNIFDFSGRARARSAAHRLYAELVAQARRPDFYVAGGVPDTVEGRFEMISLHVYVVLRRLRGADEAARKLSQYLFDAMFDDMDRNLREMGTGDLSVGRKVKGLAKAFYGRVRAYDGALEDTAAPNALEDAFARNIFVGAEASAAQLAALAAYLRQSVRESESWPLATLLAGEAKFGPAVAPLESRP